MSLPVARPATSTRPRAALVAAIICVAPLVIALLPAPEAHAWGNGGDKRSASGAYHNGYGTHDWLVDQADRLAGRPAWFDRAAAIEASGRPDVDWPRKTEHVMMDKGGGRGAAQQAAVWYVRAVDAYRDGDMQLASAEFGYLSHYYSDATQPFHAKFDTSNAGKWHHAYEALTSAITDSPSAAPSYAERVKVPATDVRNMTIQAGAYARARFARLVSALERYSTSDSDMVRDKDVIAVTEQTLSWASSGLADLLASIPSASRMPKKVARVSVKLVRTKLRIGMTPKVDVTAFDAAGQVMDAVQFTVDWPGKGHDARFYTVAGGPRRTHGAPTRTRSRATVTVTVSSPAGTTPVTTSSAGSEQLSVRKTYRTMTRSQLAKARKKARKSGRIWVP